MNLPSLRSASPSVSLPLPPGRGSAVGMADGKAADPSRGATQRWLVLGGPPREDQGRGDCGEHLVGEADRRPLVQQRVAVTAWLHNDCIRTVWSEDAHPPVHQNLQVQRVVGMARREGLEPPTLRFEA